MYNFTVAINFALKCLIIWARAYGRAIFNIKVDHFIIRSGYKEIPYIADDPSDCETDNDTYGGGAAV